MSVIEQTLEGQQSYRIFGVSVPHLKHAVLIATLSKENKIVAVENSVALCSPPFMLTYTHQHNFLNFTITVPQHTNTKLRIVCERMNLDCQYLQVAGEMS